MTELTCLCSMQVAVKQLKASILELDELANDEFIAETKLMRSLRHSNIVYFYGCTCAAALALGCAHCAILGGVRDGNSFLVLEYMARGSLDKLLGNDDTELPWRQRLELARGAAAGMQYLHNLNPPRIHRDLKSPNLLISDSFVCKVGCHRSATPQALCDRDCPCRWPTLGQPSYVSCPKAWLR